MRTLTVEVMVFNVRAGALETLLVRGPGNVWGLAERPVSPGRGLAREAEAALAEQTGVRGAELEQLFTFDRDDAHVATVGYLALISAERHPVTPGQDVVEVRWFRTDDLPDLRPEQAEALQYATERLRAKASYAPVAFVLLPDLFSMGELQSVYEAILGSSLDARNFRRDVLAAGVVEAAGRTRSGGPGRPAQLYRWRGGGFSVVPSERRVARAMGTDRE